MGCILTHSLPDYHYQWRFSAPVGPQPIFSLKPLHPQRLQLQKQIIVGTFIVYAITLIISVLERNVVYMNCSQLKTDFNQLTCIN